MNQPKRLFQMFRDAKRQGRLCAVLWCVRWQLLSFSIACVILSPVILFCLLLWLILFTVRKILTSTA